MKELYIIDSKYIICEMAGKLYLVDTKSNAENEISTSMHDLLNPFFIACDLNAAYQIVRKKYESLSRADFDEIVKGLIEKKILIPYVCKKNVKELNVGGMFGADLVDISDALKHQFYDVVFMGFPYDISATFKAGSRFAPAYLRQESKAVFQYVDNDGTVPGMWDCVNDRYVLEDVRLADCGDLRKDVYERNGEEFDYLRNSIKRMISKNIFPVIFGGDHSISLATISGCSEVKHKIGVFQFDAHDDYGGNVEGIDWKKACHHGNFMSWVMEKEEVEVVGQIGIRQLNPRKETSPKLFRWSYRNIDQIYQGIVEKMRKDIPYYITFDVDCLSPTVITSTGTPLPGGFLYDDLMELIRKICTDYDIIGLDIVELIPGQNNEGIIISRIVLDIIDYVMKKRKV